MKDIEMRCLNCYRKKQKKDKHVINNKGSCCGYGTTEDYRIDDSNETTTSENFSNLKEKKIIPR
jgi:hypothetical protein